MATLNKYYTLKGFETPTRCLIYLGTQVSGQVLGANLPQEGVAILGKFHDKLW